jgi:hypothetical protein
VLRVYVGAVMVIAGIAGFIEAHSHRPQTPPRLPDFKGGEVLGRITLYSRSSAWSRTAYDLVRIGALVLVILGAVTILLGIVASRRQKALR